MNNPSQSETTYHKIFEWLPLALIAGGLAIQWMGSDYDGLIWITGLLMYGVLGFISSLKRKYYRGGFLRVLKLITEFAIILLTLGFFAGINTFLYLLMLILLDRLILIPRTTE
jgi:hypothetical protein